MISKDQYIRLSFVLVIPLLAVGWWMVEEELLLPIHPIITCDEFSSHISCYSVFTTKDDEDKRLYRNGAVRLWGTKLVGGFHHDIITTESTSIRPAEGRNSIASLSDNSNKVFLNLPPRLTEDNSFASCEIFPHRDSNKYWSYACTGGEIIPNSFYFTDQQTNQKFQDAKRLIADQRAKNESMQIRVFLVSFLTPLIFYFLLSAALFLLLKIVKYVISGRHKSVI